MDQRKERYVIGPGVTLSGEPFVGIWDRESPGAPIFQFDEEQRPEAFQTYERIRRESAGKRRPKAKRRG